MKYSKAKETVTLGARVTIEDIIAVSRFGAKVEFSEEYISRVEKSRALVEKWTGDGRAMYGVTTGFGSLCTKAISGAEAEQLQHNIIMSHSTSVGTPFSEEETRAVLFMILQNLGQGYSGVRVAILEQYRQFLNLGITPWAPKEGSVGYLSPEAHMARVIVGEGKAWYKGELMEAADALTAAGLKPLPLSFKEGLALVSGTTSVTAMAALALYDMIKAAVSADIIAAFSLEASNGLISAFDDRVMRVRPHKEQRATADNIRNILEGSEVIEKAAGTHIQDALSLRCVPQLHGAAKKTLYDALTTIETEMNSCCDNPIIWTGDGEETVISACNPDSSYVGIEMDSASIAATNLAKMSERRNNRLIDETLSGYPSFLISNPGLNSGLMIPQYTQAGLLNDMRILSTSATIDNTPTCGNQEDYVAMGYNASKKAIAVCEKLEYILAIELLSSFETQGVKLNDFRRSPVTEDVFDEIGKNVPLMKEDTFLYPYIEYLRDLIHSGRLADIVQKKLGELN